MVIFPFSFLADSVPAIARLHVNDCVQAVVMAAKAAAAAAKTYES